MSESVRGVETTKSLPTVELGRVRQLWHLLEPLHAVLYYAPEVFEEAAALGYDTGERWPSYFPLRAAPLGPAGGERVASAFYSFNPRMVAEHMGSAWSTASPDAVLKARLRGMDRAYRAIFGDRVDSPELAEAADLARRAAEAADNAGRPLAAANAELAWPAEPHLQLWQAATILREHRGDGHLAALLVADLDPVESLVSFAAIGAASVQRFESRGWSREEWAAARERLVVRGVIDDRVRRRGRAAICARRSSAAPTNWPPRHGSSSAGPTPTDSPTCWGSSGSPCSGPGCCPRSRRWASARSEGVRV